MGLGAVAAGEKGAGRRRVAYFDVAKALAMVAVIAGHTALRFLPSTTASATVALAFSFHMPLFFVLSGAELRESRVPAVTVRVSPEGGRWEYTQYVEKIVEELA